MSLRYCRLFVQNYCPQSIGIWLAFEIFCETRANVTHVDLSNSPFTESGCYTLGDFIEQSQTLLHLNLSHCRYTFEIGVLVASGRNIVLTKTILYRLSCFMLSIELDQLEYLF